MSGVPAAVPSTLAAEIVSMDSMGLEAFFCKEAILSKEQLQAAFPEVHIAEDGKIYDNNSHVFAVPVEGGFQYYSKDGSEVAEGFILGLGENALRYRLLACLPE